MVPAPLDRVRRGRIQHFSSPARFPRSLFIIISTLALVGLSVNTWAQRKTELPPSLDPVQAEKEARALVAEMLSQKPAGTNTGLLKILNASGEQRQIPMCFEISSTPKSSTSVYEAKDPGPPRRDTKLTVIRSDGQPTRYLLSENGQSAKTLTGNETMVPFAGSDFYIADLGLEFLQWPQQRLLKKEMRKSRFCEVLESTNPRPSAHAYSRVVCWVEQEPPHGIVHADAYDAKGKVLKRFDPKEFEKVQGQYQLQEMEIRNLKTDTKTRIEFNLSNDSK
jgi:hypothetical protein